jgi:hypothetical protein
MEITLTVPDEWADRLRPVVHQLPGILDLGLRTWHDQRQALLAELTALRSTLANQPSPQTVLALRLSPAAQERLAVLRDQAGLGSLSPIDQADWDEYQAVEHAVRVAKAQAARQLQPR